MRIFILLAGLSLSGLPAWAATNSSTAPTRIIELHQTACQFIEAEGGDKDYIATSFASCEALNEHTAEARLAGAKPLKLKPGSYIFRVYNDDVPYTLGFWLRGAGLGRVTLPAVSGGGIEVGGYRDYAIELAAGEYRYSCPLNPTPDYRLRVE
ncbi:MAG: hypothetical protein Q9M23_01240 [Mariprofundaceae bacterium]|nr:hypothetical protein [Mariprofundaceae bacterium]